ncbi:protein LPA2 [Aristolochia californica]|uniref:protein LPA2 n=1 Tax=Aristolochia californica TaxID=171875 RepID=UPI0035E29D23
MALAILTPNSLRAGSTLCSPLYIRVSVRRTTRAQADSEDRDEQASVTVSSPPTKSKGLGFGSPVNSSGSTQKENEKGSKKKRNRERASVVRRTPIEKPSLLSPEKDSDSDLQKTNEGAFLLTWLGLGILIFIEGIVLSASGFLPEEWDKFFVNYLYPSFTPTVFLFVAGTVGYGVYKYLQGEKQEKI